MSLEQQLSAALRSVEGVEPSPDLWARVVHSIDEDRAHRRRVVGAAAISLATLAVVVLIGALNLRDTTRGRVIDRDVMMVLELMTVSMLTLVLGPAIRRFGRHYAEDLWPSNTRLADGLLRLLDIAYGLVFAGYILLTTRVGGDALLDEQLADAAIRVGGLLMLLGVLHAVTLMMLPLVALIDNSTRRGTTLPRWFKVGGAIVLILLVVPQLPGVVLLFEL